MSINLIIKIKAMKFDKHTLWMIIGCGLPLLLIFLAPALGISGNASIFIFIAAMFAVHLFMPMHNHGGHEHGLNQEQGNTDKPTSKAKNHEHHQH